MHYQIHFSVQHSLITKAEMLKGLSALLENLIEMDPDYFSAYMLAGQAYSLMGEDHKAYEMFIRWYPKG